jgi:hypothetical protein
MNDVGKAFTHFLRQGIAIANNSRGNAPFGNKAIGGPVATHNGESAMQLGKRNAMEWVIAVGKDDDFLHSGEFEGVV